jgi:acetyltransferase-like isoleucine patch superfamily enzyme
MTHDSTAAYPRCPGCHQIHIPHCKPTSSNSQPYSDPRSLNGSDGSRIRPIVVEDQERNPPAPSNWRKGWNEPPRVSYPEHASYISAPYSPPPVPNPERAPSHDHHNTQSQGPPPPRLHNLCVYHHTPQSMSQTANHTPAIANSHHRTPPAAQQPPSMVPPTSAPPAPQPAHYTAQPRAHKTEKEKMLNGEPFLPSDELLMEERAHCTGALYNFNNIANLHVMISRSERDRNFERIVQAQWVPPPCHTDRRTAVHTGGHFGGNVNVATPFHCDYGYNIFIAENVTIGAYCRLHDSTRIVIGKNTKIGNSVTIQTLKTPNGTKSLKGSNGTEMAEEVYIGENVYVGDNVIIEAGVRIGHNAIIRAGSVVSTVSNVVILSHTALTKTRKSHRMPSLSPLRPLRTETRLCDRFCSAACTRCAKVWEGKAAYYRWFHMVSTGANLQRIP